MKRVLTFSFFALGFTSFVSQVVIIRELMVSFYGNEFFIGWILFSWLFWTGAGSFIGARLFKDSLNVFRALLVCHFASAFLFPLVILVIRAGKILLGTTSGEIPDLAPTLAMAFAVVGPSCFLLGAQFSVAAQLTVLRHPENDSGILIGKAYWYETLGFVLAGIAFSYYFVTANKFTAAFAVAILNLAAIVGLLYVRPSLKRLGTLFWVFAALAVAVLMLVKAPALEFRSRQWRFPLEKLVKFENTVHGHLAVTKTKRQYNFYQNGLFFGSDDDQVFNEYFVHFTMLSHPDPKRVLLIGTGFNGAIREILKHHPDSVDYVEFDREVLRVGEKVIPDYLAAHLRDPRVHIFYEDSRRFLKKHSGLYDVILVNVPNPSTALINRCYMDEFYGLLRAHLKPGGIVGAHLMFSPNFLPGPLNNLTASIYHTMKKTFPAINVLPEDTLFLIASTDPGLKNSPVPLIDRMKKLELETSYLVTPYIEYRFTNDRVDQVRSALEMNRRVILNRDFLPRAYYYNLVYWLSSFHPHLAKGFSAVAKLRFPAVMTAFLILLLLPRFFVRSGSPKKRIIYFTAMAAGGFSLMAAEVMMIYAFQLLYGNLYYRIAWIIAAFAAGMGFGAWAGT